MKDNLTLRDASVWASDLLNKEVTPSNISYLIQYGRIPRVGNSGTVLVSKQDLKEYYATYYETKEETWKKQLGSDLNWRLSFSEYKESQTTKHVHRLHPYKGKFIPQLVEYFLDKHVDEFKCKSFFNAGDIILDPFCGSGTTLVQANELNLHAVGVDVAAFNVFISNAKIDKYDINDIRENACYITNQLKIFQKNNNNVDFELQLLKELKIFNSRFFPSPDFKYNVRHKKIDESLYGKQKSAEFFKIYNSLINEYKIAILQNDNQLFLDKWFLQIVRSEIDFVFNQINRTENTTTKKILSLILSRTTRSCRATTHADLGTLKEPVTTTYYCKKHGKICKPLFSILSWWQRYTQDTIKRIEQFDRLKTDTFQHCLVGDSRISDIVEALERKKNKFAELVKKNKIDGIFSSPPYVGLIDYHEQHAYAYDLFGFEKREDLEIAPLCKGQGSEARKSYVKGISDVLINCKRFMKPNYNVFLVANDKYRLYPEIAESARMKIVHEYKRPVLNRVEKDRSAYAESIFYMQEK